MMSFFFCFLLIKKNMSLIVENPSDGVRLTLKKDQSWKEFAKETGLKLSGLYIPYKLYTTYTKWKQDKENVKKEVLSYRRKSKERRENEQRSLERRKRHRKRQISLNLRKKTKSKKKKRRKTTKKKKGRK